MINKPNSFSNAPLSSLAHLVGGDEDANIFHADDDHHHHQNHHQHWQHHHRRRYHHVDHLGEVIDVDIGSCDLRNEDWCSCTCHMEIMMILRSILVKCNDGYYRN